MLQQLSLPHELQQLSLQHELKRHASANATCLSSCCQLSEAVFRRPSLLLRLCVTCDMLELFLPASLSWQQEELKHVPVFRCRLLLKRKDVIALPKPRTKPHLKQVAKPIPKPQLKHVVALTKPSARAAVQSYFELKKALIFSK